MFDKLKNMLSPGILGKYKIEGTLHHHPFYTVSAARDKKTMRPVFVKVYTAEGVEFEAKMDRRYRTRPLVAILPELRHENISRTFETEASGTKIVQIMEASAGATLRALMKEKRLDASDVPAIVTGVGRALAYLHSQGLLHRGLSPDVISVDSGGNAKITDLSLVMNVSRATAGGTVVGPVDYTAPEVMSRKAADETSDVYSLGAVLYEMLCGATLFPYAKGYDGLLRRINAKPEPVSQRNPEVSAALAAVVMKAVSKRPEDRYDSVEEMLGAFEAASLTETRNNPAPAYAA